MASRQAGGRLHAQADVVPDEDLSGCGGGPSGTASQQAQSRSGGGRVGAGGGVDGGGDDGGRRRDGGVDGGLQEGRGSDRGSVCRLVGGVESGGGAAEVQVFINAW